MDDDSSTAQRSSIDGSGTGGTSVNASRKKRLDPSDPSTWTSTHTSPLETRSRSSFDAQEQALPKISVGSDIMHELAKEDYDEKPKVHLPKKHRASSGSMAAVLTGDLDSLHTGPGQPLQKVNSPTQTTDRSNSPSTGHLSPTSPKTAAVGRDEVENRRLSNQSASFSTMTDESVDRIGPIARDENDEEAVQESSEEEAGNSDVDEGSPVSERGRKRKSDRDLGSPQDTPQEVNHTSEPPAIQVDVASTNEPVPPHSIQHSGKLSETYGKVTPRSNYNRAASPAALSAMGDDNAELQRAKTLQLRVSPMDDKIPDRHVKMLIRGDWSAYQDPENEQQEWRHEPRLYLVCSDLSNEASYALEWTVGTLLKDGDTLLVISALEDEHALKHSEEVEPTLEVKLESAKAAEETNATMASLTRQTTNQEGSTTYESKSSLRKAREENRSSSRPRSRTGRHHTKRDDERNKAVEKLEADFLKSVRKTTLQVRCMIEVIHCRSPRHLILNAIDELEPTLVVVGTRGLSAVKNVVMGSFSNYLVQKSSIPVMVARKRLKKAHHAKISSQQIRMTNNLTPFGISGKRKSLTQARID